MRISNASGAHQADTERDLRGAAVRLNVDGAIQDLLMTNFPVPHAKDGNQFVAFAKAMSGNRLIIGIPKLMLAVGHKEARRMLRNLRDGTGRTVHSVATETFWSRGALLWGEAGPVRYLIRPVQGTPAGTESNQNNPNYLRDEIAARLGDNDLSWELCIQRFISENVTPVENAAAEWPEKHAPPIVVAKLILPRQDVGTPEAQAAAAAIEQLAFNPWNTTAAFRPLGHLNRARKAVYAASAARRGATV